jgi:hypothetical protein
MSVFIVSDNHIHTILSYILDLVEPNTYINPLNIEELEKTGNMFLKQNHLSYNSRYGLGNALDDFLEYKFKEVNVSKISTIQFIKLLNCLDYQCSETSDYDNTETHTKIQQWVELTLRNLEYTELQEYQEAEWCID